MNVIEKIFQAHGNGWLFLLLKTNKYTYKARIQNQNP